MSKCTTNAIKKFVPLSSSSSTYLLTYKSFLVELMTSTLSSKVSELCEGRTITIAMATKGSFAHMFGSMLNEKCIVSLSGALFVMQQHVRFLVKLILPSLHQVLTHMPTFAHTTHIAPRFGFPSLLVLNIPRLITQ